MREDRYLNISDVTKSYPNPFGDEIAVVKGFDLTVTKGEVISIIGHSGCGKSTVLNMVAGLIPVSLGGIILESCEVKDPGPDRAVVFPSPMPSSLVNINGKCAFRSQVSLSRFK